MDDGQCRAPGRPGDPASIPISNWSAATRGRTTRSAPTSVLSSASIRSASAATDDVDALLALRPDCVSYNPMWPDVDEMCRILGAGINIVSTAAFITGRALGRRTR